MDPWVRPISFPPGFFVANWGGCVTPPLACGAVPHETSLFFRFPSSWGIRLPLSICWTFSRRSSAFFPFLFWSGKSVFRRVPTISVFAPVGPPAGLRKVLKTSKDPQEPRSIFEVLWHPPKCLPPFHLQLVFFKNDVCVSPGSPVAAPHRTPLNFWALVCFLWKLAWFPTNPLTAVKTGYCWMIREVPDK